MPVDAARPGAVLRPAALLLAAAGGSGWKPSRSVPWQRRAGRPFL